MKIRPSLSSLCRVVAVSAAVFMGGAVQAAVNVGALAVVGYSDDESDPSGYDTYAMVATETINAGETFYITNNGWNNTTRQFDGVWVSDEVGAGAENLVKLTINSTILAGTIIRSNDTASSSFFSWTTSGSIPMPLGASGNFSPLDLKHSGVETGSRGDEIYIFQASSTENPLLNISKFIYAIDFGDRLHSDTENWFDPQESGWGGNLPDGLVSTNPVNAGADFIVVPTVSDQENSDPNDNTALALDPLFMYYNGTYGLDLSNPDVVALQVAGGTKAEWLQMLNNSAHWGSASLIFDYSNISANYMPGLSFVGVPEPSRAMLVLMGCMFGLMRRRRVA